jgi:hypothetical protein
MPSRRAYLGTLAAVGVAGCLGNTSGTSSRPAVTIESAAVQYAYRHIENVDWGAVRTADGQFVFVTIDASETDPFDSSEANPAPSRDEFLLLADDGLHKPLEIEDTFPITPDIPGKPYRPDRSGTFPRGWLVFDVRAQLDTEPSLRLGGIFNSVKWELDTVKATAPPPAWEWTANVPDTVAPGETFDITVSAKNVGNGPGTFRGVVNFSSPMYKAERFDIVLHPGESGKGKVSTDISARHSGGEETYQVRTPAGRSEVAVTVETEPNSSDRTTV